jgi:hypothetical protein
VGHAESTQELEKLCKKHGIDPNEDLLTNESSQNTADDSSDADVDLDDISDGSGTLTTARRTARRTSLMSATRYALKTHPRDCIKLLI